MLRSHGVSFLVGAITTEAVGAREDNESNKLHVCYIDANHEEQVRDWDNGKSSLWSLRAALKAAYATPGNMHWGTDTDLSLLSTYYNIGFLVFSDIPQGNGSHLYSMNAERADWPYWICLYCIGTTHFQLLFQKSASSASPTCFFSVSDISLHL